MNEDQNLQELFQRIRTNVSAGDELRSAYQKKLDRQTPVRMRLRIAMAGGLIGATALVGLLALLLPTSSAAGAFARVEAAISDAKTMHIKSYSEGLHTPKHLFSELFYSKGDWRVDAFPGSLLARTYIGQGPDQWMYQAATDVAVQEPNASQWPKSNLTALEFAKAESDEGMISSERDFAVEPRPDEGLRKVYAVVATRKDTPYHLEMIVDKKTNLPIRSVFSADLRTAPHYQVITKEYSFGDEVGPEVFSPRIKPTTKVVNLIAEANALKSAWNVPVKTLRVGGTSVDVRDVTVNEQGEVFIACSFGKPVGSKDAVFPENLLPNELKDDRGRTYILVETTHPGGTFGDTRAMDYMKFGNDKLAITEWAPLDPTTPWVPANSIDVAFVARTWMGSPTYSDMTRQINATFVLPKPISDHFPSYSSALLLDEVHLMFEMNASDARGGRAEKSHDYAEAAKWYRDAAMQAKPLGWSARFEKKAVNCERKLSPAGAP